MIEFVFGLRLEKFDYFHKCIHLRRLFQIFLPALWVANTRPASGNYPKIPPGLFLSNEFRRTCTGVLSEPCAEEGLVGEIQFVAYFLYIILSGTEQGLGFEHHVTVNPLRDVLSSTFENHLGKMLRGDAQFVGVETDFPALGIM